jgi:hypothetical protein
VQASFTRQLDDAEPRRMAAKLRDGARDIAAVWAAALVFCLVAFGLVAW